MYPPGARIASDGTEAVVVNEGDGRVVDVKDEGANDRSA